MTQSLRRGMAASVLGKGKGRGLIIININDDDEGDSE